MGAGIICHTGDYINVYDNSIKNGNIAVINSQYAKIYKNTVNIGKITVKQGNKTAEIYDNTIIE